MVAGEPAILGPQDSGSQRRRDFLERNPLQPPHPGIYPHLMDHAAVPVEQQRLGGGEGSTDLRKRRDAGRREAQEA